MFPNILKTPLNISYFYLKNKSISNHLGKKFTHFLAVVGAGEEDSDALMLPASAMLKNCFFSNAFSDMEYFFQGGNH